MRACSLSPESLGHLAVLGIALVLALALAPARVSAQEQVVVDIRQGTDLAIALSPDGQTLVMDLLGGLWRLPRTGGGALPLVGTDEEARHPQFSPDGNLIVYERRIGPGWDLWALDLTSGRRWAVTSEPGNELDPSFLGDGATIVFAGDRMGQFDIYSMPLGGGPWQLLVDGRGDARFPAMSERGELAYVERTADGWSLRLRTGSTTSEILPSPTPLTFPVWRPGGGVLVFHETDHATRSRLRMLILAEDRVLRSLTDDEDVFAARPAWITPSEFLYTADGQIWRRRLAARTRAPVHLFAGLGVTPRPPPPLGLGHGAGPFAAHGIAGVSRSRDGTRTTFAALGDIWLIEGETLRPLTEDPFWDTDPIIAADGRFVVFSSDRAGTGVMQIYRIDLTVDGPPQQLTFGVEHAFRANLDFTGTRLAYLTASGPDPHGSATLHVRYLDDATELRGDGVPLVDAGRPEWLADSSIASLAIVTGTAGARTQLTLDAALRVVGRTDAQAAAPPPPPARVPDWRPAAQTGEPYVIQAGRLFAATGGGYQRHVDIHIEGGRIRAVVGRNVLPLPARVIDATELTVVPGLIDVHVHASPIAGVALGQALLAQGVTSIRATPGDDPAATLARAEAWAAGRAPGPRMILPAMLGALAELPIDYPVATSRAMFFDDPVAEAGAWDLAPAVIGSTPSRRLSPLFNQYQDFFGLMAALSATEPSALALPTTSSALRAQTPWMGAMTIPAISDATRSARGDPEPSPGARALAARQAMLDRLIRSGARVALGSETPSVTVLTELELLAAAGIAPDQVLRIATIGGALALGLDQDLGTIEDGKIADLVVVAGDPLVHLESLGQIRGVVIGGEWLDPRELGARSPFRR